MHASPTLRHKYRSEDQEGKAIQLLWGDVLVAQQRHIPVETPAAVIAGLLPTHLENLGDL